MQVERSAAEAGTFLGDGYGDFPFSTQRAEGIRLDLTELGARREALERQVETLQAQIAEEQVTVARQQSTSLVSPGRGLTWVFLASDNEYVRQGQDLVTIVMCDTTRVTASVSERIYNGLQIGDEARFRLTGEDEIFAATVDRLAGSRSCGGVPEPCRRAGPEASGALRRDLSVPELADHPTLGCAIGRTGRVLFSVGPAETSRRIVNSLGFG